MKIFSVRKIGAPVWALTLLLCTTLAAPAQIIRTTRSPLEVTLSSMEHVTSVTRLESNDFAEKYELSILQQLDPNDIRYGFFDQRVFVMHKGFDRPTVLVTEGYGADYASRPRYREELSRLLDANLIVVEHRFFSASTPQPRRWQLLTGELAMSDIHIVREMLKDVYKGKWIATGISKGGQTALMYRTLYPDDVDITVSYVGPLCQDVEDGRHEPFLANEVGTKADRDKILAYQKELLIRKDSLIVPFKAFCEEAHLKFDIPLFEVFDFCVLEYPFAFWQWGTPVDRIPETTATDKELLDHLLRVSSPDYFVRETPNLSFFIQAAKQLGYYGYDTKPFDFKVERTRFEPDGPIKEYFTERREERAKQEELEAEQEKNEAAAAETAKKNKQSKKNQSKQEKKRDKAYERDQNRLAREQKKADKEAEKSAKADSEIQKQKRRLETTSLDADNQVVNGQIVTRKHPALDIKTSKGYLKKIFLPDFYKPRFNKTLYKRQLEFIQTTDKHLVFIYGEWDPWTAAAVPNPNKPNVLYYVNPKGSHSSRIGNLPEEMRTQLMSTLERWLAEETPEPTPITEE